MTRHIETLGIQVMKNGSYHWQVTCAGDQSDEKKARISKEMIERTKEIASFYLDLLNKKDVKSVKV